MNFAWTDWLGYAASVIIAVSLTMSNIRRLRWINLVGSIAFTIYGLALKIYPVFAVNGFIVGINIYYLLKMKYTRDQFHLLQVSWETNVFLPRFLQFYEDDIKAMFPDTDMSSLRQYPTIMILRNVIPVGLFVFEERADRSVLIHMDYVIPSYRDYENGRYFFSEFDLLMLENQFQTYICTCNVPAHQRYLRRMNFKEDPGQPGRFVRKIPLN